MRLASFPATSSMFRRSLLTEYSDDEIRALEPRKAALTGDIDKNYVFYTATVTIGGGVTVQATARTAPAALRLALSKWELPEIVSVLG